MSGCMVMFKMSFFRAARFSLAGLTIALSSQLTMAQTIPLSFGWHQLANTKIDSVCAGKQGFPEVLAIEGCSAIESWSGGTFDTRRNRLIVWGGGHGAYYGNELYALNVDDLTMTRLNDPGLPLALCTDSTANGTQPASRHSYDGIEYMSDSDRLFVFAGAHACPNGGMVGDTWTFRFDTMSWQKMNPGGNPPKASHSIATAYDPNTRSIFAADAFDLYRYSLDTNTWTNLTNIYPGGVGYGHTMTATIDPARKKFVMVGRDVADNIGKVFVYDIGPGSSYARQTLPTTGGGAIFGGPGYPGVDYDPARDRIVAWNGGDIVYSLNLNTNLWTAETFPGGPGALAYGDGCCGTYGRWRYSVKSGIFVVVNGTNHDAYALRLAPPVPPPASPTSLTAN
jgi:hypothetical protein